MLYDLKKHLLGGAFFSGSEIVGENNIKTTFAYQNILSTARTVSSTSMSPPSGPQKVDAALLL